MKPWLLAAALSLLTIPAEAHKLKLFATTEGAAIHGTAYFSGGDKAMRIKGQLLAPDGTLAGEFTTDDEGRFVVEAGTRADYTLSVDAGDGHVATLVVPADQLPEGLPPGPIPSAPPVASVVTSAAGTDAVEAAVARQIRPLREQLDAYEDKVRLHDILGGIGTIFGLFGVAAWLSARRRGA